MKDILTSDTPTSPDQTPQAQARQAQVRQDQARQDQARQDQARQDQVRQAQARPVQPSHADASAQAQPRAVGRVRVSARLRGARSVLDRLHQSGSAKALFPRTTSPDLQAVLLNTAGGITGGDRFAYDAAVADGAALTVTTQAAERAYRAQPGQTGTLDVTLAVAAGAVLHWLPQETIAFDGASLARSLTAEIADDAALLAVEPIIFGRRAMGERVRTLALTDNWRVRRGGRLVYADALRIAGDAEAIAAGPATLGGAGAMASILYAAPDAQARLAPLRALLPETAGASLVRPGILAARILAADGFTLRRALVPALEALRGAPLPTVWKM